MAIETRFSGPQDVQALSDTSGVAIGRSRDAARNERNKYHDISDAFKAVGDVTASVGASVVSYKDLKNKQEITDNNLKLADLMSGKTKHSTGATFTTADAVVKEEMLNDLTLDVGKNSDKVAQDAFTIKIGVMSGNVSAAAHEEVKVNKLLHITDDVSQYFASDSEILDKEGNPVTNYKAGRGLEDFVDMYSNETGYSKTDIARGIMTGRQKTDIEELNTATSSSDVDAILAQNIKDNGELMKSTRFGASNSPEMQRQIAAYQTAIKQKSTALKTFFKKRAQASISEKNQANAHQSVRYQYALNKQEYIEAYDIDKWEDKYTSDLAKQTTANAIRDVYINENSLEVLDRGDKKEIQAAYQEVVDTNIQASMGVGDYGTASDIITSQGGYDSTRVKKIKNTMVAGIANPETRTGTLESFMKLEPKAQVALFSDKKGLAQVLALNSFMKQGRPSEEAYNAVYNIPAGTPATVLTRQENIKVAKLLNMEPGQLRTDTSIMIESLKALGVPADTIIDAVEDFKESDPYTTKMPGLNSEAEAVYTGYLDSLGVEDGTMELVDNSYVVRDKFGIQRYKLDKNKTLEAAFDAKNVSQYWKDNPIESLTIKGLQSFGDWATTSMFDKSRNQSYQGYQGGNHSGIKRKDYVPGTWLQLRDVVMDDWSIKGKGRDTK